MEWRVPVILFFYRVRSREHPQGTDLGWFGALGKWLECYERLLFSSCLSLSISQKEEGLEQNGWELLSLFQSKAINFVYFRQLLGKTAGLSPLSCSGNNYWKRNPRDKLEGPTFISLFHLYQNEVLAHLREFLFIYTEAPWCNQSLLNEPKVFVFSFASLQKY